MTDRPVRLSQRQRDELDAMSPEQRHQMSEIMHHQRHLLVEHADLMDRTADMVSRNGPIGPLDHDYMNAIALQAEVFRAIARDDVGRARELNEATAQYNADLAAHGMRLIEGLAGRQDGGGQDGDEAATGP